MQKQRSFACYCNLIQNKLLWLNKLVRLNKAVLYNEELINVGIFDYDHLINSAGEILNYDGVTKKFDLSLITLLSLNFLNYLQQYLLAGHKQKLSFT